MRETIQTPAYIVLDIPSPMAEKVQALRRRFDVERAAMPAEVTLTGSCGIGLISLGQSLAEIQKKLDRAARKISPFTVAFGNVERFLNTDIYYLTFRTPAPFVKAHEIIAASGIRFEPSNFPYKPHCTLKLRKPPENEQELLDLFFLNAPREEFRIDTLSLYALSDQNTCELLHKCELGDKKQ